MNRLASEKISELKKAMENPSVMDLLYPTFANNGSLLLEGSPTNFTTSDELEADYTEQLLNNFTNNLTVLELPVQFTQISSTSRNVVIIYCLIFLIGVSGNLSVFLSFCHHHGPLSSRLKWRISILIKNLSLADLIVICTVVPSEIFWRLTVAWLGGNSLCKIVQFGRAFGLYLSSNIIICISLDRFVAIVYPLKMVSGSKRVKIMLGISWFTAGCFAFPQVIVFSVQHHPIFTSFTQCVTYATLTNETQELIYNLFSVAAMYFIPLVVIIFSYSMILWKIIQKSKEHRGQNYSLRRDSRRRKSTNSNHYSSTTHQPLTCSTKIILVRRNTATTTTSTAATMITTDPSSSHNNNTNNSHQQRNSFRDRISSTNSGDCPTASNNMKNTSTRSSNDAAVVMMARAKWKILRLTCIIVVIFVFCSTPYVLMLLWYMFDRTSAAAVNVGIQDGLFMMVVANSCVNPFVYGNYTKAAKNSSSLRGSAKPSLWRRWWCSSVHGVSCGCCCGQGLQQHKSSTHKTTCYYGERACHVHGPKSPKLNTCPTTGRELNGMVAEDEADAGHYCCGGRRDSSGGELVQQHSGGFTKCGSQRSQQQPFQHQQQQHRSVVVLVDHFPVTSVI